MTDDEAEAQRWNMVERRVEADRRHLVRENRKTSGRRATDESRDWSKNVVPLSELVDNKSIGK